MDWLLYGRDLRHERVKRKKFTRVSHNPSGIISKIIACESYLKEWITPINTITQKLPKRESLPVYHLNTVYQ